MSIEERLARRAKNERFQLAITAGLFIGTGVLVLIGIWMIANCPKDLQIVAQGFFGTTIVLAFGNIALMLRTQLVHKDVADDLDATTKVAEKVNGGTAQTLEAMTSEHGTSVEAIRQDHEAALKALREEHSRDRHRAVQDFNSEKLTRAVAEKLAEEKSIALVKAEAQVRDLTEKLARCAEAASKPQPPLTPLPAEPAPEAAPGAQR